MDIKHQIITKLLGKSPAYVTAYSLSEDTELSPDQIAAFFLSESISGLVESHFQVGFKGYRLTIEGLDYAKREKLISA